MDRMILQASDLKFLIESINQSQFTLIGPTTRDRAVIYDEIETINDLPQGWTDTHEAGTYRLQANEVPTYFGYTITPFSWKKYLHPPTVRLLQSSHTENGFTLNTDQPAPPPRYAFLGVRPCELRAIEVLDRVFLQGEYIDPIYQARRNNILIITANCSQASSTCFCTSVGGSPQANSGFDLSLTEITNDSNHFFVVEVGSDDGQHILESVPHQPATEMDIQAAKTVTETTAQNMGRAVDTLNIKQILYDNLEHPRWEQVAQRCLTCANCTMVCPTCFCNTVEDMTDLTGEQAERWRRWDSCFTSDFSYIHGGNIRQTSKARYRQWLTHKFASWQDQFDSLGCVGCGRCITWCPASIDITEELNAIRSQPK